MTKDQDRLYWREWGSVRKTDPAADRHSLHVKALGHDKSHAAFSNADFDQVLAAFRAISDPANVEAQLRQLRQPRARLLHAIGGLMAQIDEAGENAEGYAQAILRQRFHVETIGDVLHEERFGIEHTDLEMLRMTLNARLLTIKRRKKEVAA